MKKDLLVTFPFEALVRQLFGEERRYYVPLEPVIADVIEWHILNSGLSLQYKVQREAHQEVSRFVEYAETKLEHPRLWIYSDWYDSSEAYNRSKARNIRDRENEEMFRRNLKVVAQAYRDFTAEDDIAKSEAKAYALLKGEKMKSIYMLGVKPEQLITDRSKL